MQMINRAPDLATSGWVVEANLADAGEPPDRRFFAVGLAAADEAVEAVLGCPGMARCFIDTRRAAARPDPSAATKYRRTHAHMSRAEPDRRLKIIAHSHAEQREIRFARELPRSRAA